MPHAGHAIAPPACAHCRLPVPAARVHDGEEAFCCAGCETVYRAIRGAGSSTITTWLKRAVMRLEPARWSGRGFEELDDAAFTDEHVVTDADGLSRVELLLEGVHCRACLWLVERLPLLLPGVRDARLDLGRRLVEVRWDAGAVALSRIARQLDRLGYPPHPAARSERRRVEQIEDRRRLLHLAVAGAIAGNVMLLAFALYGGMFHGMEPRLAQAFRGTSLGLTALSLAWPGRTFFRGAWAALRSRTPHMDLPVATGLTAGFAWSAWATLSGAGEIYCDSIALPRLPAPGRTVDSDPPATQGVRRAGDALLHDPCPRPAHRAGGGGTRRADRGDSPR